MIETGEITMQPAVSDRFTPEQKRAILAEGRTIVSASAGSGKTTVMIEKMIRLIIYGGVDVGEILAVTYTKKAAASMKEKLRKALIKAYNVGDEAAHVHLKRQIDRVAQADISTIHSFCSKLIKTHFFAVDVGNRFNIISGEDADGVALKNQAIEEIFEEAYTAKDEDFLALLSVYFRKKSDNRLRSILSKTYDKLRTDADYVGLLQRSGDESRETFDKIVKELFGLLKQKCEAYLRAAGESVAYFTENGQGRASLKLATELQDALCLLINSGGIFAAKRVEKPVFSRKEGGKKLSPEYLVEVEKLALLKERVGKIFTKELTQFDEEEIEWNRYREGCGLARAVAKFLLLLDEKYSQLKRAKGVLDYNDLEHLALKLLSQDEIAAQMRSKYKYVFVDEYQDVNPVQERILNAVYGDNVFLVGDIKQSIYGFRGSKSKFFAQKQAEYEAAESAGERANSLLLTKNFRSADAVLDAVNGQFEIAMTKQNSEVDYRATSVMARGGLYAEGSGRVNVHFVGEEAEEKGEDTRGVYSVRAHAGKKAAKASLMAERIAQIIKNERLGEWYDAEIGGFRPVRYRDIAVLSRKKGEKIGEVIASLAAKGIPVTASAPVNICEYPEIKTLLEILQLIDNEEQDVPLCTALLSQMGRLTEDDLAAIRLQYRACGNFREACKKYAKEQADTIALRLREFFEYLKVIRGFAQVADAGEVLTRLIADLRLEADLLASGGGENCMKRVHRLLEETHAGEAMDVREFLNRLKMLDYEIEYCENGGEDAVHVLTMHASKGLEYPVVIVENLSDKFHGTDTDDVFVEEQFGLAPKCYNLLARTQHSTVLRRLFERRQAIESVRDELNLYYVALTRAQYSLHMIFDKEVLLPDLCYARSFAELTTFSVWERYKTDGAGTSLPFEQRQALAVDADEELTNEIMGALDWQYAHGGCEEMPAKSSATALMRMAEAGDAREFSVAFFDDEEEEEPQGATDVQSGKAYHAFLEHFDFTLLHSGEPARSIVESELLRMANENAFDFAYFALLDCDKLAQIVSYPVFLKVAEKTLYRERNFMAAVPARTVLSLMGRAADCAGEDTLILQGAIDLLAVGEEDVEIIDYKYSQKNAENLKKSYALQLRLYKEAVAKALKVDKERISCTIVNIFYGFEVEID